MGAVVEDPRYTYLTDDPQRTDDPYAGGLAMSRMRAASEGIVKLAMLEASLRNELRAEHRPGVCAYCGGENASSRCSSCGAPRRP